MTSVLTAARNDMCYCPGCSHGVLLEHLGRAIDALGLPPNRVCLVTDIGCIGTADRYFACHTFHGLHGRSITYAEGIKRARPEMLVVVLIGDGGCGIGTAHLVHAARRGTGIKIIVANNFNFGMTGGQHSPTTPPLGVTATTPGGATERPFDICGTVVAAGADYVARCSVMSPDARTYLQTALATPGFALVDLWELCSAYYVQPNKLNAAKLDELSRRLEMPFGVLCIRQRHVEPLCPRATTAVTETGSLRNAPPLKWGECVSICIAGSAGQRIRSAAGVLGEIAVAGGLFAAQQDDFPITVRRGHSISNLLVSRNPILFTGADPPDLLLLLSEDGLNRFGRLSRLPPSSLVVADRSLKLPPTPARVRVVDADALSRRTDRNAVALAMLAWSVREAGWVESALLQQAAEKSLGGAYRTANLDAINAGLAHETAM